MCMSAKYVLIIAVSLLSFKKVKGNCIPDSLKHKGYDYIFERIESPGLNGREKSVYLKSFLLKAKSDKNFEELTNAYKNYLHHAPEADRLVYADSMVLAAKLSKDDALIGSAYLSKGIAYYAQRKLDEALASYLLADRYIAKTGDKYLKYKAMYSIGQIKYYLGYYDEAMSLLQGCTTYMKGHNSRGYLNSLYAVGLCHNKQGNHGLCTEVNHSGILECRRLGIPEMVPYFNLSEGANQCELFNYQIAVIKLSTALSNLPDKDFANKSVCHFFLGKSYWHLGQKDRAKDYFERVHQSYLKNGAMLPDLREAYELLIIYYKERSDLKLQLYYVETLLKLDRELALSFRYLVGKIHKEYDTRELLSQKKTIETSLTRRKYNDRIFVGAICTLCIVIICLIVRYARTRKIYREKYEELLLRLEASKREKVPFTEEAVLSVSQDAAENILHQLEKFESSKKYVDRELNLMKLAVLFGTNTTYLSKVIAHHRNKKFNDYINDLKVDYIAQRIKDERLLRKYNNKALAEEAGFSTTRRFVIAFEARNGISPTYYIEELTKDELSMKKKDVIADCTTEI